MVEKLDFDVQAAHRHFSADCFDRAWDLIEKPGRTNQEDEAMLLLSLASLWHWTQRDDRSPTNLSVGYWQVSRVYALLNQADNARLYAQLSLEACQVEGIAPFYLGYAYEALARAESVAGNWQKVREYLSSARRAASRMSDLEEQKMLLDDLSTIKD